MSQVMGSEGIQLSSPFSTGGGGHTFENHVQSAFVVLMLTGGAVPCLEPWPIKKIKLQGKYAGYNTDDFIAFVECRSDGKQARLLAQIKRSVSITDRDTNFGEAIAAAWADFQNPQIFDPKTDAIALITGPLSSQDVDHTRTILDWARHAESAQDFVDKVKLGYFSSTTKQAKLQAFRSQLKNANHGTDVTDEQLWQFLRRFYLLGYDLDMTSGITLSLLNSHIAQFACDDVSGLWAKVSDAVGFFNQSAGVVTLDTLPEEILRTFRERRPVATIPAEFLKQEDKKMPEPTPAYPTGSNGDALLFANLIGSWNEKAQADLKAIQKLIEGDD